MSWVFNIDVVGFCNLRCPTCPIGNSDAPLAKGAMPLDLMDRIVRKAVKECGPVNICLYNWTEPFLHPRLADLIRVIKSYDVPCGISTNLNIAKNIDAVIAANPDDFRVSVSGFSQGFYGTTHKRGDIEVVKRNMVTAAEAKTTHGGDTRLEVLYHRYLGNHDEESTMREFAESLGFSFHPVWAYLMPLEKTLAYAGEDTGADVTEDDRRVIDSLALPLKESLGVARKHRSHGCDLRDKQMAIDLNGRVTLCCAVYDPGKYGLGNYLDHSLEELQAMKNRHAMCGPCMKQGAHVLAVYGTEELDRIALKRVSDNYPDANLSPTWPQQQRKSLKKRIKKTMRHIFANRRAV